MSTLWYCSLLLSSLLKALILKSSNRVDMKDHIYGITFLDGSLSASVEWTRTI